MRGERAARRARQGNGSTSGPRAGAAAPSLLESGSLGLLCWHWNQWNGGSLGPLLLFLNTVFLHAALSYVLFDGVGDLRPKSEVHPRFF